MSNLIDRPSGWEAIGDHERRIRALEATPDCCPDTEECVGFPDRVSEYSLSTGALDGYWRLGDGASPFADTSGATNGPRDAVKTASGVAMSPDVTGCLPAGEDDGAVQFNEDTGIANGDYLVATESAPIDFSYLATDFTVMCWVKPFDASANLAGVEVILENASNAAFGFTGWRLYLDVPARTPSFIRRDGTQTPSPQVILTGPSLPDDQCSFLAFTYDTALGHSLYVNGELVDSDPTTLSLSSGASTITFARTLLGAFQLSYYGVLDEVAVWETAFSQTDIAIFYQSGSVCAGEGEAGMVLTLAANGSSYWAFPTIEVEY